MAASQKCHWYNGDVATDYVPCHPEAGQSSCCKDGEVCLVNGLCYGAIGMVYRGACTDWSAGKNCPDYCVKEQTIWANLYRCYQNGTWWCGNSTEWGGPDTPCGKAGESFRLEPWDADHIVRMNTTTSSNSSSSNASTTTSTASASSTSTASSSSGTEIAIGAGVGIPLALIALALLTYILIRRRRRKQSNSQAWEPVGRYEHADEMAQQHGAGYGYAQVVAPQELNASFSVAPDLQELGASSRPVEMSPNGRRA